MNMMTSTASLTAGASEIVSDAQQKSIRQLIADHKAAIVAVDVAVDRHSALEEEIPRELRQGDLSCGKVTEVAKDDPRWTAACHLLNDTFRNSDDIAIAMLDAPIENLEDLAALMAYAGEHAEQGLLWPEGITHGSDEEDPKDWIELVLIKAAMTMRQLSDRGSPTERAKTAERDRFSRAFSDLEPEVCDLARSARLAQMQLYQAVGELQCVGDEYTEVPEYEAVDLATFTVDQVAVAAKKFEKLYYRLHSEAVAAGTRALTT